jgi:hypothetical protein
MSIKNVIALKHLAKENKCYDTTVGIKAKNATLSKMKHSITIKMWHLALQHSA